MSALRAYYFYFRCLWCANNNNRVHTRITQKQVASSLFLLPSAFATITLLSVNGGYIKSQHAPHIWRRQPMACKIWRDFQKHWFSYLNVLRILRACFFSMHVEKSRANSTSDVFPIKVFRYRRWRVCGWLWFFCFWTVRARRRSHSTELALTVIWRYVLLMLSPVIFDIKRCVEQLCCQNGMVSRMESVRWPIGEGWTFASIKNLNEVKYKCLDSVNCADSKSMHYKRHTKHFAVIRFSINSIRSLLLFFMCVCARAMHHSWYITTICFGTRMSENGSQLIFYWQWLHEIRLAYS